MKKIVYILLLLPLVTIAQVHNHIKTITQRDSANTTTQRVDVTYFDGLGRPIQQVHGKMGGDGKDVITHIEYDGFGRQLREYLPYVSTSGTAQAFDTDAYNATMAYYNDNTKVDEPTANPWSEKFLEPSPLGKVLKQAAPGNAWAGNPDPYNNGDHSVKFAYLTNTADGDANDVKKLSVTALLDGNNIYGTQVYNSGSTYAAGKLYKTVTKDENWTSGNNNTVEEYKNKEGQIVLKRTYNGGIAHDTYYVYDQFGNLTYVLPPLMNGSNANINTLGYQYKYDSRNRLVEKKLPGKQWEFIVYDPLDRAVLSGPALNPWGGTGQGWLMTIYDDFGRVAMTGWYPATVDAGARKSEQNNRLVVKAIRGSGTNGGINTGYNPISSPPASFALLTANYYDDYTWMSGLTFPITVETQKVRSKAKGLPTGSWVRVLDAQANTTGETSYTLYDFKGRAVRGRTANYLGGYTQVDTKLDFDGSPVYTKNTHKRVAADTEILVTENFTYTAQDRLASQTHKINALATQTLFGNTYNKLGQLKTKTTGSATIIGAIQNIGYKYNARGWLTDINDVNTLGSDLFAFKIAYNTIDNTNGQATVPALYNGNISETYWKTSSDNVKRKYSYAFDNLNRLTYSYYQKPGAGVVQTGSYNESIRYDVNGNITGLSRFGGVDDPTTQVQIDELTYSYAANSNQLQKVYDASTSPQGFKDVNTSANDYTYDANGNMLTDLNKGITSIRYNHLNLPVEINFGSNKIAYLYDASGRKLKKTVTESGTTVYVDYLAGGFQYKGGVLQFFPTAEGYVDNTVSGGSNVYNYIYQYKDHLGNIRVSYTKFTDKNGVSTTSIKEENHYYPFGVKHLNYNMDYLEYQEIEGSIVLYPPVSATGKLANNYKFLGQERQEELGLGWDTFRHRNYDYAIGRFFGVDPITEDYYYLTPYQFAHNNPVWKIELEGLEGTPSNGATDVINSPYLNNDVITRTININSQNEKHMKEDVPLLSIKLGVDLSKEFKAKGECGSVQGQATAAELSVSYSVMSDGEEVSYDFSAAKASAKATAPGESVSGDAAVINTKGSYNMRTGDTSSQIEILSGDVTEKSAGSGALSDMIAKVEWGIAEVQLNLTQMKNATLDFANLVQSYIQGVTQSYFDKDCVDDTAISPVR